MDSSQTKIKLIIGLGNPDLPAGRHGKKYENTYHNAGHLFIEYLESHESNVGGQMSKSDVYMNESGRFVSKIAKKSGIKPENILIAHDDSDILIGDYKISFDRSSAGHKGIESIINSLGTQKFWRLRIGIRPQLKDDSPSQSSAGIARRSSLRRAKAGEFVLKKISSSNKKILEGVFRKANSEMFQKM